MPSSSILLVAAAVALLLGLVRPRASSTPSTPASSSAAASARAASAARLLPRGADPSLAARYAGDSFACLDGSATLARALVNDDFCDCRDGSDEPGTSACAGSSFHCPVVVAGLPGAVLTASRVCDGICDCCDGSDELTSGSGGGVGAGTPAPLCQNTCAALSTRCGGEGGER